MKKVLFALWMGLSAVAVTSCKDSDKDPLPATESVPNVTTTNATPTLTQANARNTAANPTISFVVSVTGPNVDKVEAVEVYKTFRNIVRNAQGQLVIQALPRVLVRSIAPTQTTIEITLNDLVANLQRRGTTAEAASNAPLAPLTRSSLTAQESFLFTYELIMKDGRRVVLTPNSGGVVSGTQTAAPFAAIVTITN